MLKLKNISVNGKIISMLVLVELDENKAYELSVERDSENNWFNVIKSDIPGNYRAYEHHAKVALRKYSGKELPDEIVAAWY